MARPLACHSPCRNLFPTSKDELASPAPTKGSDTYTLTLAISHALTSVLAPAPALPLGSAPVDANRMVKYSEADLQRILRTVLEARPPALAPAPQPLAFPNSPRKRPLKARFSKLYCNKTHMECYNFIQQCKDHFATAKAKRPNCIPFAATFLQE